MDASGQAYSLEPHLQPFVEYQQTKTVDNCSSRHGVNCVVEDFVCTGKLVQGPVVEIKVDARQANPNVLSGKVSHSRVLVDCQVNLLDKNHGD